MYKRIIILLVIGTFVIWSVWVTPEDSGRAPLAADISFVEDTLSTTTAIVGGGTLILDIATTSKALKKGLGGRSELLNNSGMIFVFDKAERHSIWMKDMLFSIDILWLDRDFRVVHLERDVSPETFPEFFVPPQPAGYVIEIAGGNADVLGISLGEKVIVSL